MAVIVTVNEYVYKRVNWNIFGEKYIDKNKNTSLQKIGFY